MVLSRAVFNPLFRSCQLGIIKKNIQPFVRKTIPIQYERFSHSTTMDRHHEWDNMISFWFDRDPMEWFFPPEGLDDEIKARYQDLIVQARSGALDDWAQEPKGVLCLVLLLDQFPRNIFRDSGESFSSDGKAQGIVTRAIAQHFDEKLGETSKVQQSVLYLPLTHAEDLLAQVACTALNTKLLQSCPEGSKEHKFFTTGVELAKRHMSCVAQLGRFPKRNAAIGRPNTAEEDEFLEKHPQGF